MLSDFSYILVSMQNYPNNYYYGQQQGYYPQPYGAAGQGQPPPSGYTPFPGYPQTPNPASAPFVPYQGPPAQSSQPTVPAPSRRHRRPVATPQQNAVPLKSAMKRAATPVGPEAPLMRQRTTSNANNGGPSVAPATFARSRTRSNPRPPQDEFELGTVDS